MSVPSSFDDQSWSTLITAFELASLVDLDNSDQTETDADGARSTIVFDCRFSLADVDEGDRLFRSGHIPGAFYAHLDHDLSSTIVPGRTGRHPLPESRDFVTFLEERGVCDSTQVVCYDDKGGAIAARLWWMCKWIGHEKVAVLDGGIQSWINADYTLEQPIPPLPSTKGTITATVQQHLVVDATALEEQETGVKAIDARASDRYSGGHEPIDPIGGHIPGALSFPFAENLDNGRFKNQSDLRARYASLSGVQNGTLISYCGSGVTAAHNILAIVHAGFPMPRLYAGSWSDWITNPERTIETGS